MKDLNFVIEEGNLTRDPELKYLPSATSVCNFTIATNRYYKVGEEFKQEVSYFDIVTYGNYAENCNKFLKKGGKARVTGKLKQERWEQDGKTRSRVVIIADHVEFTAKKAESNNQSDSEDCPF